MRRMEEKILSAVSLGRNAPESPNTLSPEDVELICAAVKAMGNSYSPYSCFPVGAAILTSSGAVYTGCNIENASYGLTMCAERTTAFKAVSVGDRHFKTIAIAAQKPSWPCGACRQVLNEFSDHLRLLIAAPGYPVEISTLSDLLPHSFGPADLEVSLAENNPEEESQP